MLGRPGTPGEIADLIAFLVSPASSWITGETIALAGAYFTGAITGSGTLFLMGFTVCRNA